MLDRLLQRFRKAQAEPAARRNRPDFAEYLSYQPYAGSRLLPVLLSERPDIAAYREMRLDGQVSAGLAVIKLPILSRPFAAEGPDVEVAEFVQEALGRVWRSLVRATLLAVDYGFVVLEKVWKVDEQGRVVYKTFKDPAPETLDLEVDEFGSYAGVRQRPGPSVPAAKAFLYTHRLEHGNLYGISRLRPAYPYWRTKEIIYLFLNRYLERKGNPPVVVKFPPAPPGYEGAPSLSQEALALGKKVLENAAIALPHLHDERGQDLWDVTYLEDAPRVGMFLEYIEHLNKMILRAMFVPEKLVGQDETVGSYALASVHADMFLMSEEGLIADLEEHFNRFLVKPLVAYNFGPRARATVRIQRFDAASRELLGQVFMEMLRTGKVQVAAAALARELGVPVEEPAPAASDAVSA